MELRASFEGEGYPVDVAISGDGEVMQVVYLCMKDTVVSPKVSYYNFGKKRRGKRPIVKWRRKNTKAAWSELAFS